MEGQTKLFVRYAMPDGTPKDVHVVVVYRRPDGEETVMLSLMGGGGQDGEVEIGPPPDSKAS